MKDGGSRMRVSLTSEWPITNGVQRSVLLGMYAAGVPNEMRLAVTAAFLRCTISDIYRAAGLSDMARGNYRGDTSGTRWEAGPAWHWSYRVALTLGFTAAELWDLDEDFDPLECLPLNFDCYGNPQYDLKGRKREQGDTGLLVIDNDGELSRPRVEQRKLPSRSATRRRKGRVNGQHVVS